jgi:xylulokinase
MQGQSYTDWPFLLNCLQVVGEVCPEVAQQLGLGPGVLVSPGSGDNAMSALGSGITQ